MPAPIKFRAEYGEPLLVRVTHNSQKYILRITQSVLSVTPTGGTDPTGMPQFTVSAAPVMVVEKDPGS